MQRSLNKCVSFLSTISQQSALTLTHSLLPIYHLTSPTFNINNTINHHDYDVEIMIMMMMMINNNEFYLNQHLHEDTS